MEYNIKISNFKASKTLIDLATKTLDHIVSVGGEIYEAELLYNTPSMFESESVLYTPRHRKQFKIKFWLNNYHTSVIGQDEICFMKAIEDSEFLAFNNINFIKTKPALQQRANLSLNTEEC